MKHYGETDESAMSWVLSSDKLKLISTILSQVAYRGLVFRLKQSQHQDRFPEQKSEIFQSIIDYIVKPGTIPGEANSSYDWTTAADRCYLPRPLYIFQHSKITFNEVSPLLE